MKSLPAMTDELRALAASLKRPVRLMEVCGTHTMAAFRTGLRSLLPENVKLVSGPGCPVCVTPNGYIDKAVALAKIPDVLITTFGDMLKVPGSESSLETARARGAKVQVVYSQSDALNAAVNHPDQRVIFLGVGFETTAPATAWTIKEAFQKKTVNYSVLCSHKTMPMAMRAVISAKEISIDGFLCPGHVSIVTGTGIYEFICREFGIPCVVAGFEAADMMESLLMLLSQIKDKRSEVEIQYRRCVAPEGNEKALSMMAEVFEPEDTPWRGFGLIPGSGLRIRKSFASLDAEKYLNKVDLPPLRESKECRCGEVLRGVITPRECPLFRSVCTPDTPEGACMVSSEGTCAAYYKYGS